MTIYSNLFKLLNNLIDKKACCAIITNDTIEYMFLDANGCLRSIFHNNQTNKTYVPNDIVTRAGTICKGIYDSKTASPLLRFVYFLHEENSKTTLQDAFNTLNHLLWQSSDKWVQASTTTSGANYEFAIPDINGVVHGITVRKDGSEAFSATEIVTRAIKLNASYNNADAIVLLKYITALCKSLE